MPMPRKPRLEFPAAMYHVMSREISERSKTNLQSYYRTGDFANYQVRWPKPRQSARWTWNLKLPNASVAP
jgi:hypothetical protein